VSGRYFWNGAHKVLQGKAFGCAFGEVGDCARLLE
jgi:hypothetical protein